MRRFYAMLSVLLLIVAGCSKEKKADDEPTVAEIIATVQTLDVVPNCSDGSVMIADTACNRIRFEIFPLDAARSLAETGTGILAFESIETSRASVSTKAALASHAISAVEFDGEFLVVTVDGREFPEEVKEGRSSSSGRQV